MRYSGCTKSLNGFEKVKIIYFMGGFNVKCVENSDFNSKINLRNAFFGKNV